MSIIPGGTQHFKKCVLERAIIVSAFWQLLTLSARLLVKGILVYINTLKYCMLILTAGKFVVFLPCPAIVSKK